VSKHLLPHQQEKVKAPHQPPIPGSQPPPDEEMETIQLDRPVVHVEVTKSLTQEPFVFCVHVDPHEIKPGAETYIWQPLVFDQDVWITDQFLKGWGDHIHHILAFALTNEGTAAIPFIFGDGSSVKIPRGSPFVFELHYLNQTIHKTEVSALAFQLSTSPTRFQVGCSTASPDDYQDVLMKYRRNGKPRFVNVTATMQLDLSSDKCKAMTSMYDSAIPYAINTHTHGYGLAVHFEAKFRTHPPVTFTVQKDRISKGGNQGGFFYKLPDLPDGIWDDLISTSVSCLYDVQATPVPGAMGMELSGEMCEVWIYTNAKPSSRLNKVERLMDASLGIDRIKEIRNDKSACVKPRVTLQAMNTDAAKQFGDKTKATDVKFLFERRLDPSIRFDGQSKCSVNAPMSAATKKRDHGSPPNFPGITLGRNL
jgi:hypothetical protein